MREAAARLLAGVCGALGAPPDELRFEFYILYAAAQRMTWRDHTGEEKLAPEERQLCDAVEDAYRELDGQR